MRCPVCRADTAEGPQCRRCRADLSLLFALEDQRRRLLLAATAAVTRGDGDEAVESATAAEQLRGGEDARRLIALGRLLQRDFAAAWAMYSTQPVNG
jgi:hypothetical protein